ncbi:MAG: purine-nucleoside phosphorylase [Erysipelotrichaceae bacterium]|nr:purine-nucleoside phosphorylase [Erysipelotrichaceae bacterium]
MSTPHNQASMGDIAKVVLMPGDPLRAKFIAETFLENPVQFNSTRNMFGYTGTYKGKKVSVMGSGMGIPSLGIYAYELYNFYGVEAIIRIGTAGSYKEEVNIYDVCVADSSYSESSFAKTMSGDDVHVAYPSEEFNELIFKAAEELNIPYHKGRFHSGDVFYHTETSNYLEEVKKNDCILAEMESFGLFHTAKVSGKKAASICTISDSLVTHQETTAEERQTAFTNMMKIALEAAIAYE